MSSFSLRWTSDDRDFYNALRLSKQESYKNSFLYKLLSINEEMALVELCKEGFAQDPLSFKIRRRSLILASALIDDRGELNKEALETILAAMQKEGFHLPAEEENNSFDLELKQYTFLAKLKNSPVLWNAIRKFDLPLCSEFAKKLIHYSLQLPSSALIRKKEIRIAALAAGLGYLRQNVGSCFATAPAILIHSAHFEDFYSDLYSLFSTGKLKRVFGGIEYVVPMSLSTGSALLKKRVYEENGVLCPSMISALKAIDPSFSSKTLEELISLLLYYQKRFFSYSRSPTYEEVILEILKDCKSEKKEEIQEYAFAHFKACHEDPLLKIWEYSLASFSEVKMEFSNWNLYTSLGLNAEDEGGIGPLIYHFFQENLNKANQKVEELHSEYIIAYEQVKASETLIAQAYSEDQIRRLKSELTARHYHLRLSLEMRQEAENTAKRYADLYPHMIKTYKNLFPEYFQEIFDPDITEIKSGFFDDAPAGFRLLFKHGRSEANAWTPIFDEKSYIDALISFFKQSEYSLARAFDKEEVIEIVHQLNTEIILHLQNREFINSAYERVKKNQRGENNPSLEKKPWAYVSGGTLSTLIKTYYRREGDISMENRVIENPTDLLCFIIDTLKSLSTRTTAAISQNRDKKMLCHSPTHAFLLMPGAPPLFSSWQNNNFTYTWIRDEWVSKAQAFWKDLLFSFEEQEFLIDSFFKALKEEFASLFIGKITLSHRALSLKEIKEDLMKSIGDKNVKSLLSDLFDSFCHSFLPILPKEEFQKAILKLQPLAISKKAEELLNSLPYLFQRFTSAYEIRKAAKALLIACLPSLFCKEDVGVEIFSKAQALGYAPPSMIKIGDTNWENFFFSFVINPVSGELELWRTDKLAEFGIPMSLWEEYLNGKTSEPWTIYTDPFQWGG